MSEKHAQLFHETYERLAPAFQYETRKVSAVPWDQVPNTNRNLMIAVAKEVAPKIVDDALWECDMCGFRFSKEHAHEDGSFSCPECECTSKLNFLGAMVREISESKGFVKPGWEDTYGVPAQLMLIVTEVAEACEAFRIDDRLNFAEEMADIIIRCLHMCARLEIDIDEEIRNKIEKNKTREHKHGGKRL